MKHLTMSHHSDRFRVFETQYNDCLDRFSTSLETHYLSIPGLEDELTEQYGLVCTTLGVKGDLDTFIKEDLNRELHLIQSDVGDDEYTTTDSLSLGPALIGFGPIINGIKLSWKDSGISHYVGNYAEGWVITPPSAESTFEVVHRRHARSGVPFTLDMVKLKLLSPVRKQSQAWDLDLESKLEHLAEVASWTDRSWFTYDYHQMCLILANAIFDFEDSTTFPYLFKTEGGCGGAPPYGNLDTVYGALHYYTRGKSKRGILGIMEEAVAINTGSMKPKDSFFLRNSHLANMGDAVWLRYESAYRSILKQEGISKSEANDLLRAEESNLLPDWLQVLGTEVNPESFVVGNSLSALRKEGLLMSEMDVKTSFEAERRNMAILGDKPIGVLNQEIKDELAAYRGKHLKVLSQISSIDPTVKEGLRALGLLLPEQPDETFRHLVGAYFSMRTEEYSRYSSLHYTDAIRVYKTHEVREVLERHSAGIRADIARTESVPKPLHLFLEENLEEAARRTLVHDWFNSKPLSELLYNPMPPGIGTDDDRIVRSIIDVRDKIRDSEYDYMVVILFSGDRQLARITSSQMKRLYPNKPFRLMGIDRSMYTRICLEGVRQAGHNSPPLGTKVGAPRYDIVRKEHYVEYYNYILKRRWPLPMSIIGQAKGWFRSTRPGQRVLFHVEYDYPNMERGLDTIRLDPRTNTMEEYGGGYLERRTLRAMAEHDCWAKQELDSIYSWTDFDLVRSRRNYPLGKARVREDKVYGFDPESIDTYRQIDSWRKATIFGPPSLKVVRRPSVYLAGSTTS